MRKKKRKKLFFKKFLTTYVIVLTVLMILTILYVINSLLTYKKLQVNNYLSSVMDKVISSGKKGKISKFIDVSSINLSEYESKKTKTDKVIAETLKTSELVYKLNNDSTDLNNPIYDVYINNKPFLKVSLNGEKKITRLGLLTMQDWKVNKIEMVTDKGLYDCIIEVPNEYKVYVNDIEVKESDKVKGETLEELNELSKYADLPYIEQYKISNLLKEPKIEIKDKNGKVVTYEKDGETYSVKLETEKISDEKDALQKIKGNIDIKQIAKDWSLYLSNDLGGSLHGFYKINQYLIKDSYMYKYAYKWATNVDITFISQHTFDNPAFSNIKVSNFEIYNENAFSCEVYLEKNMLLTKRGNRKIQDVMNEKMYFAYYNGEWKLVNMQSLSKNK